MGRLSLKRAREEQGAPMAPRARNPPPPVAVPAARAQPDLGDAIQLVLAVKREFAGVPGKYEEFLAVLQEHRSIGVAAVIDRVKVLLAGHPDLIRGFNMFIPRGYKPRDLQGGKQQLSTDILLLTE
ncbi:hypothetical protein PVAP13_6KG195806 [Panicum virgatum]|uniref:Uncharacterized protein n=1 Tax=Panicum virgatum TaxID=38727 RepID=A0A8T0RCM1_PANVG|nr:hypothetical protein PVAP13_6KG195806 [Panicum virgatum]